jgi:hypothetical protein
MASTNSAALRARFIPKNADTSRDGSSAVHFIAITRPAERFSTSESTGPWRVARTRWTTGASPLTRMVSWRTLNGSDPRSVR